MEREGRKGEGRGVEEKGLRGKGWRGEGMVEKEGKGGEERSGVGMG